MSQQLAVGIDIGGTNTKFGVVDRRGNILCQDRMSTKAHEEVTMFLEELHRAFIKADRPGGGNIENIQGIGVGAPNGNFLYR